MVRIPQASFQKVSEVVGTPGVDPSAGRIFDILSKTASVVSESIRQRQNIAAKLDAREKVLDYTLQLQKRFKDLKQTQADAPAMWVAEGKREAQNLRESMMAEIQDPQTASFFRGLAISQGNQSVVNLLNESDSTILNRIRTKTRDVLKKAESLAPQLESIEEVKGLLSDVTTSIKDARYKPRVTSSVIKDTEQGLLRAYLDSRGPSEAIRDINTNRDFLTGVFSPKEVEDMKEYHVDRWKTMQEDQVIEFFATNLDTMGVLSSEVLSGSASSVARIKNWLYSEEGKVLPPGVSPDEAKSLVRAAEVFLRGNRKSKAVADDMNILYDIDKKMSLLANEFNEVKKEGRFENPEERRRLTQEAIQLYTRILSEVNADRLNPNSGKRRADQLQDYINAGVTGESESGLNPLGLSSGPTRAFNDLKKLAASSNSEPDEDELTKLSSKEDYAYLYKRYTQYKDQIIRERQSPVSNKYRNTLTPEERDKAMINVRADYLRDGFQVPVSRLRRLSEGKSPREVVPLALKDGYAILTILPDFTYTLQTRVSENLLRQVQGNEE